MFVCIWCEDNQHGIAKNNQLPWKIPEEMQHFKQTTLHHKVLMGAKTFFTLKKPLVQRVNYVASYDEIKYPDVVWVNDLQAFINEHATSNEIIYVIGGKSIYDQLIPYSTKLIISRLHANYDCDLFMEVNLNDFKLTQTIKHDEFSINEYCKN